jgi:hypothetical protein
MELDKQIEELKKQQQEYYQQARRRKPAVVLPTGQDRGSDGLQCKRIEGKKEVK